MLFVQPCLQAAQFKLTPGFHQEIFVIGAQIPHSNQASF